MRTVFFHSFLHHGILTLECRQQSFRNNENLDACSYCNDSARPCFYTMKLPVVRQKSKKCWKINITFDDEGEFCFRSTKQYTKKLYSWTECKIAKFGKLCVELNGGCTEKSSCNFENKFILTPVSLFRI